MPTLYTAIQVRQCMTFEVKNALIFGKVYYILVKRPVHRCLLPYSHKTFVNNLCVPNEIPVIQLIV